MKNYVIAIKDYYLSKEEQEGFTLVTFPREVEFATKYHDKQQADKIAEEYGGKAIEVLKVHGQSGQVYYQKKQEIVYANNRKIRGKNDEGIRRKKTKKVSFDLLC